MINGFLNIYKPVGVSSNNVVTEIKKILNIRKVGHAGTLDPLACGVLPICIGSATKISEYLLNCNKTYSVNLKFGILTDTYDCEGKILKLDENVNLYEYDLNLVLESFIGEYDQIPPKFSALKVNGKRAYDLARRGIEFELRSRRVKIYSIENIRFSKNECSFIVKCSKGTYIRSLCKDIGDKLGTYATMTFLERICSGNFKKEHSINFDGMNAEIILDSIVPIEDIFEIPKLSVDDDEFLNLLVNGVSVKNPKYVNNIRDGIYYLYSKEVLIGICEKKLSCFKMIKFLS